MKQIVFMAAMVLLAASCSNENEEIVSNAQNEVPVRVHVSNFSISMGEFSSGEATTRAAENPANYNGVGALTLAFYAGDTEAYKTTQIKSDNTTFTSFGDFSFTLAAGTYTMVALGYLYKDGDVFTLTSPTEASFSSDRPREVFCLTQSVTLTNGQPLDLDVTLKRISAMLNIISTDGRPAEATKVRITFAKGGKSFNPSTGLATVDTGFSQVNNPSGAAGATIDIGGFLFLYTDEESMTVTIQALDADENVLFTKVVPNVPFKRNRKTTLSGEVYSETPSSVGFHLETDWLTGETVNF